MITSVVLFCLITLMSASIRVTLLNSKTCSKNIAIGGLLHFVDLLFIVTFMLKPMNFDTVIIDSLLTGLYFYLCQNIMSLESELVSKAKNIVSLEAEAKFTREQSEELMLQRDQLIESSDTRLKQLKSEVGVANATTDAYLKRLEEVLPELDVLLEANQSLKNQSKSLTATIKELESELETTMKDVNVAQEDNIILRKQIEESLLENGRLSETNQVLNNQLQSSGTRLQQLESEIKNKSDEANAAEAKVADLRKGNKDLVIQLQSSSTSLKGKDYELESKTKFITTVEEKNLDLRRQLDDLRFEHDRLVEKNRESMSARSVEAYLRNENQILKNQLQTFSTKLGQLQNAEAIATSLRKEIQSLKNQLQSSEIKLKQAAGSAEATSRALRTEIQSLKNQLQSLENKLEEVKSAEATLRKENQSLKNQLQSSGTKRDEAKAGTSAAEKYRSFLFDQF